MEKGRGIRPEPWSTPKVERGAGRNQQRELRRSNIGVGGEAESMESRGLRAESLSRQREQSAVSNASHCETY